MTDKDYNWIAKISRDFAKDSLKTQTPADSKIKPQQDMRYYELLKENNDLKKRGSLSNAVLKIIIAIITAAITAIVGTLVSLWLTR